MKPAIVVAALSWLLWQGIRWAIAPGFWGGSWLHSEIDTAFKLANDMFRPVLLVKWWLQDPLGTWGDKWLLLHQWGQYETAGWLLLIIGVLWVVISCALFFPMLRRAASLRVPISHTQMANQATDEDFKGQINPRTDLP